MNPTGSNQKPVARVKRGGKKKPLPPDQDLLAPEQEPLLASDATDAPAQEPVPAPARRAQAAEADTTSSAKADPEADAGFGADAPSWQLAAAEAEPQAGVAHDSVAHVAAPGAPGSAMQQPAHAGPSGGTLATALGAVALATGWSASPPAASAQPSAPYEIKGVISLGPVFGGNGLTVTVYDKNGKILGTSQVGDDGSYAITVKNGYVGPIVAIVTDHNNADDYISEATRTPQNLGDNVLRGVSVVDGKHDTTLNVNPLTELAAVKIGVDSTNMVAATTVVADIAAINKATAALFNLPDTDPTAQVPELLVKPDTTLNPSVDSYGMVLALLSGLDQQSGSTAATIAKLDAAITGTKAELSWAPAQVEAVAQDLVVSAAAVSEATSVSADSQLQALEGTVLAVTDTTPPGVQQMAIQGRGADGQPKSTALVLGDKIRLTLTMSEVVAVDGAPELALLLGGATRQARYVSGSGSAQLVFEYTVQAGDNAAAGSVTLGADFVLASGAAIIDVARNKVAGGVPAPSVNTLAVDTTAPVIGIDTVAGDDVVNAAEKAAGVVLGGTSQGVEAGQTVTVNWGGVVKSAAVQADGSWRVTYASADVPADAPSSAITADVKDAAGNPAQQASKTIKIDSAVPSVTLGAVATDDVVNAAEKSAGVDISGSVSGLDAGSTVTLDWAGAHKTATVLADGTWRVTFASADVPQDAASSTLTVQASDAAGNSATASRTVRIDSAMPSVSIGTVAGDDVVNAAEKTAGVTISGNTTGVEEGQSVTVNWAGTQKTATVLADGSWQVTYASADVPVDAASSAITADVQDVAGNAAQQASKTVAVGTRNPSIGIDALALDDVVNAAEKAAGVDVGGSSSNVEQGQIVTVNWGGTQKTATVLADGC